MINREKTARLIDNNLGDKIQDVVENLDFDAKFRLERLKTYIYKQDENSAIDEKILVLHIKYLAEADLKESKTIKKIVQSSNKYPLNACLQICKKHLIKDAWAYLELKRGKILDAISITYDV